MALANLASSSTFTELSKPQRKKRTRPVSACENCHSKKVKCLLKPDEPVCQRCSSSGAECLFRVDDLSSDLRLQRFNDYGPPKTNVEGGATVQGRVAKVARRSLVSSEHDSDSESTRVKRRGLSNEGNGKGKAKATFRSFANPAKLGPPSRRSHFSNAGDETYASISDLNNPQSSHHYSQDLNQHPTTETTPRLGNALTLGDLSTEPDLLHLTYNDVFPSSQNSPSNTRTGRREQHSIHSGHTGLVSNDSDNRLSVSHLLSEPIHTSTMGASQQSPKYEKIALPFFRWFGATANTPGIRRIQVGVKVGGQGTSSVDNTEREKIGNALETLGSHSEQSHFSPSIPLNLFEADRQRYPRREILIQLVGLVVKYFKASCFPWLDEDEVMAGAEVGELPAILANALCAVGAQISNHPDLGRGNAKTKGEPFSDMAKVLIVPMLSWPSLDVIEALLVISYSEFALGADAGLWMYIGMALRMAADLGLQYEATIMSMSSRKQQDRARLLFWAIVSLDRITCFGTGRSVSIREDSFDCKLPALEEDPQSDGFVFGHIVRTLLKRGRIGELLNQGTNDMSLEEKGKKLQSIWYDLTHYYETLPPALQFGVTTFRRMANANQGAAFVYLHILLQSIMSLLNRPSLLRRFDKDFNVSVPSKLASIANQASGTIVSILRFAEDASSDRSSTQNSNGENPGMNPYIDCNPYLDQLILPAGRAFLAEKEGVRDALRRLGYAAQSRPASRGGLGEGKALGNAHDADSSSQPALGGPFDEFIAKGQYAQMNLMTCQHMLDRLATWWSGADWPARALRQETAGAADDDVDPNNNDGDAQPAPVRDVEMVLKWAKAARGKKGKASGDKTPRVTGRPDGSKGYHEIGNVEKEAESMAAIPSLFMSGDSTASGESPLGLGFSGQFSTTTEVDTEALINAWTNQGVFGDFFQQPPRSQGWESSQTTQQVDGFNVADTTAQSGMQQTLPQSSANPSSSVNLDFTTMQLEEFFRTGLEPIRHTQPVHPIDQDPLLNANGYSWDGLPSALLNAFTFHYS